MKILKIGFIIIIGFIALTYIYIKITEPKSYEECKVDYVLMDNIFILRNRVYPITLCAGGEEASPEGLQGCPNGIASADEYAHYACKHFLED